MMEATPIARAQKIRGQAFPPAPSINLPQPLFQLGLELLDRLDRESGGAGNEFN
jgi:hypothetical protein